MHDVNGISINTCLQIITSACCIQNISSSYASVRLNWLTKKMTIRKKMHDLHLADFVELQVKSKEEFDTAHDIALSAGLGDIKKKIHYFSAW